MNWSDPGNSSQIFNCKAYKKPIWGATPSKSKQFCNSSNNYSNHSLFYYVSLLWSELKKKNPSTFLFILKSANLWTNSLKPCIFGSFVNGPKIIFHTPVLAALRKLTSLYKLLHCLLLTLHPLRHFDSLCFTPTSSLPLLLPGSPKVLHQLSAGSLLWAASVAHLPAWDGIFTGLGASGWCLSDSNDKCPPQKVCVPICHGQCAEIG